MQLFDQPKAEAVLKSLLETSKKHEKELSLLRKLYNFSPSPEEESEGGILLAKLRSIETRLDDLTSKVDKIDSAIQIPGGNAICTVGEGVAANRKTLARTLSLVAEKANTRDMQEQAASHRRQVDETTQELKTSLANVSSVEKINAAMSALSKRIDVIASELKTKADDAEIKLLQCDAALIKNHSAFIKTTNEALQKAEGDLVDHNGAISKHTKDVEALTNKLSALQDDIARRAVAEDLASLLQRVEDMSSSILETTNKSDFAALKVLCDEKHKCIAKVETDLESLLAAQTATSAQISNKIAEHRQAVGRLVSGCVSREALSSALSSMQAELQRKAGAQTVENVGRKMAELSADYATTKKKCELASDFVTWYTNRGDSYEHNLQAVDNHLKKLAR